MILHPTQSQIAKDKHRFRVFRCGRRWGKTSLDAEEIKGVAIAKPSRIAYIANNYQQARDIMWEFLKKELLGAIIDTNEARLEIRTRTLKGGESLIVLRGWESVENLRGQAFDLLVLDEVATMRNFWINWHEILRPTLTDRQGIAIFSSTPKGFNHFFDLCNLELKDREFKTFHFTSYDNPYLPVDELNAAKETLPEDRFSQEYLAEFTKTTGLVYKEFSRALHLYEDDNLVPKSFKRYAGVDFGYRNPAAVAEIYSDGDRFFVSNEWYKTEKTDIQIAEYVAGCSFEAVYPDPENPAAIEELNRKRVNVREVAKGKGSVEAGISKIQELFKTGKLKIHKRCINLIAELESYSYDEEKDNRNANEKPIKRADHMCFVAGTIVNGKKIEEIGTKTGTENVYEYEVAEEKLIATPNHPVLTNRGLIDIDTLRYDDVVWKKKKIFMMVSAGLDIQTVLNGLKGVIISAIKRLLEARERDYIDIFGERKMERCLKDSLFIILTAIPSIIQLVILGLWSAANTLIIIGRKKSASGLERTLKQLLNWPLNGLKLQPVKNVGENWGCKMPISCTTDRLLSENATYAEKNTSQNTQREVDSAISTVVRKRYVGRVPVYNLKTKSGMYLANGIMVSNCDATRYCISMLMAENGGEMKQRLDEYFAKNQNKMGMNSTK